MSDFDTSFSYIDPQSLPELVRKKRLRDLDDIELFSGSIKPSQPIPLGEAARFSFKAEAKGVIFAFNGLNDVDGDGVLVPTGQAEVDEWTPRPLLELTKERAWLKYSLDSALSAELSGGSGGLGFAADGEKALKLNAYRRHALDRLLGEAAAADLSDFRIILNKEHVARLEEGDALSLHVAGRLDASLTLSWSDVFASQLGFLTRALKSAQPLFVDIKAGLTFTAGVSVRDAFTLAFSRADDGRIRVALKKANSRQDNAALTAGVTAQLRDPQHFEDAVNALLGQFFKDIGIDRIEKILAKANMQALSNAEKKIVSQLIDRLGLEGPLSSIAELRDRWNGLKSSLAEAADDLTGRLEGQGDALADKIDDAVASVLEALLHNSTVQEIDDLVDRLNPENLDEDERELLETLLNELGLSGQFEDAREFLGRYEALKARIQAWVESLADQLGEEVDGLEQRIDAAIQKVREALLGSDFVVKVDEILAGATRENIESVAVDKLDELLKEVGVHKAINKLQALNAKWKALKQKAGDAIRQAADAKVRVGFSLEYHALSSETSLLEALMTKEAILDESKGYHRHLLLGRLEPVLAALTAGPQRDKRLETQRYFFEKSVERRKAWGFTLGIGAWSAMGRDEVAFKLDERRRIEAGAERYQSQLNFAGTRSYRRRWGGEHAWTTIFSGSMAGYSEKQTPSADELRYGLQFNWSTRHSQLRRDGLKQLIDHAVLWRALPERQGMVANTESALQDLLGKTIAVDFHIELGDGAFRELLQSSFSIFDTFNFGQALAAGMHYWDKHKDVMGSVSQRRKIYGHPWFTYLNEMHRQPLDRNFINNSADWGKRLESTLRNQNRSLARSEGRNFGDNARYYLMSGLIALNGDLYPRWEAFVEAMRQLREAIDAKEPYDFQAQFRTRINHFFAQSHWVRALGHYALTQLALLRPQLLADVNAAATVTVFKSDGKTEDRALNIGHDLLLDDRA